MKDMGQGICVYVVDLIEWVVNNIYLMQILHIISVVVRRCCRRCRENSMFKDMSVAFICDGNRRYMKRLGLKDDFTREEGLRVMYELVDFGYSLGVREFSFFCFGLKNFRRPKDEVEGLMGIVRSGSYRTDRTSLMPRFKVYGRLELLDEDIRNELVRAETETQNNTDIVINIFFAYSAEDEIKHGISFSSHVDLVVRTGGVRRLSDFMLRQVSRGTGVFFTRALWPEFTTTHLYLILLHHWLENRYLLKCV